MRAGARPLVGRIQGDAASKLLDFSKGGNAGASVPCRNSFEQPTDFQKQMTQGSATAPVRPQAVPVDTGCDEGEGPVINTSTPPGHVTPFTVTAAATR
jgi:hypothetical protein